MKAWSMRFVLPTVVLLSAAACAHAAVVTVSPENMQGWSIEINYKIYEGADYDYAYFGEETTGELTNAGAALWEKEEPFVYYDDEVEKTGRVELGEGAFYGVCNYAGWPSPPATGQPENGTPCTVWLGTDQLDAVSLAGVRLDQIRQMKYYCYMAKIPVRQQPQHPLWDYMPYWVYAWHPISLQLTAESPDGTQRLLFWYLPWHKTKVVGENSGLNCKKWLLYDCMAPDDPEEPFRTNRWYCWRGVGDEVNFASWSDLVAQYGEWKLVATSTNEYPTGWKSAGWDETSSPPGAASCTATGKCLNFEAGARKCKEDIFQQGPINWWRTWVGMRGYVDMFAFAVDRNGDEDTLDPGEEATYNFEPSPDAPTPKIAARNTKVEEDSIQGKLFAQNYFMTKICGRSAISQDPRQDRWFPINDRHAYDEPVYPNPPEWLTKVTRVYAMDEDHEASYDEYWSAWGLLEKPKFPNHITTPRPWCLWTTLSHCLRLHPVW